MQQKSLSDLILHRQTFGKELRIREASVRATLPSDHPLFPKAIEIASTGAIIDTDPSFVPQSNPEPPRKLETLMCRVIAAKAAEAWSKNRGCIFRYSALSSEDQARLHLNPSHWTPKPDDPLGRWLIDPSNRSDDALPLNTKAAKELAIHRYVKASYVTLAEIVQS